MQIITLSFKHSRYTTLKLWYFVNIGRVNYKNIVELIKIKYKATSEFYEELWARIDELEFITDGLVHLYYEPSIDGRLFLVNSRAEPLGYKYEAVYNMKTGRVDYYKTDEF